MKYETWAEQAIAEAKEYLGDYYDHQFQWTNDYALSDKYSDSNKLKYFEFCENGSIREYGLTHDRVIKPYRA